MSGRVLLAAPRSFCAGVDRAIEIVERLLEQHGPPVYVRHQIVHNEHVVRRLEELGAVFVEDEDEVRTVLNQILVSKGYRVLQASSGEEALILSRLHRGAVHLLLTDVTMPEMKGPELAQRLRAERPQTRVVFMSGYNDEELSDGGPAAPICLQKPFSPQVLGEALRAVLDLSADLQVAG